MTLNYPPIYINIGDRVNRIFLRWSRRRKSQDLGHDSVRWECVDSLFRTQLNGAESDWL